MRSPGFQARALPLIQRDGCAGPGALGVDPIQQQTLAKVYSQHQIIPADSPKSPLLPALGFCPVRPCAPSYGVTALTSICCVIHREQDTVEPVESGGSLFHYLLHHCWVLRCKTGCRWVKRGTGFSLARSWLWGFITRYWTTWGCCCVNTLGIIIIRNINTGWKKILTCNYVQYSAQNTLRPTIFFDFFFHVFSLHKVTVQVVPYSLGLE